MTPGFWSLRPDEALKTLPYDFEQSEVEFFHATAAGIDNKNRGKRKGEGISLPAPKRPATREEEILEGLRKRQSKRGGKWELTSQAIQKYRFSVIIA